MRQRVVCRVADCARLRAYSRARSITSTSFSPGVGPSPQQQQPNDDPLPSSQGSSDGDGGGARSKAGTMLDSALTTMVGVMLLAGAGIAYHHGYKYDVLRKMRRAFKKGYDPVLELANASMYETTGGIKRHRPGRIRRKEQDYIDRVVNGEFSGEYLLLLGPKGVGKTTLLVEAMIANEAEGVAMVEAHEDPEVFRLRLGKALDFEYSEDSFAGLFQRRDPREAGPLLDIERALNKLEKVAIKYRKEMGRPLCLIFNNIHFIHDDDDGHALLHALQQRAESWAQAGVVTTIFNSDDFAPYQHLKKNASRMHVISVRDLTPLETHICLASTRASLFPTAPPLDPAVSFRVWDLVGGRLSVLNRIAKEVDMEEAAESLVEREAAWLNSRLGLIPDHDDDVMDEQKVSSCSFLLFQEFAKLAADKNAETHAALAELATKVRTSKIESLSPGVESPAEHDVVKIADPMVEYRQAREIMTRPDYIQDLDHHNIINVDVNHHVRPDSRLLLSVFRKICEEPDFQEKLDNVRDRVDEIESLHRTSELTVKSDNDLGGVLRLRLLKKGPDDTGEGNDADEGAHLV